MESKMLSVRSYEILTHECDLIPLDELALTVQTRLSKFYQFCETSVVDCPDLTAEPFNLVGSGLGGKTAIADIGGAPYLLPTPTLPSPIYSFLQLGKSMGFSEAHIVGAAFSPFLLTGKIAECMPNLLYKTDSLGRTSATYGSYYSPMINDKEYLMGPLATDCANVLANVFISENKQSKVLKISVRKRIDKRGESFPCAIRDVLREAYPGKFISIGGVFLVRQGKVLIHVMPNDFCATPCDTPEKVDQWLNFFEASAPIVAMTAIHSNDPNLNLRDEHTHCFGKTEGGHYHNDTTPDTIEYEAYLNLAQQIVRIDKP